MTTLNEKLLNVLAFLEKEGLFASANVIRAATDAKDRQIAELEWENCNLREILEDSGVDADEMLAVRSEP